MNDAPLATQIKEARSKLGLSQTQAAAAWNVPVKTLQKWEQGIREPRGPALNALRQKLAGAVAGNTSAGVQPQNELPQPVPAPETRGDDASLDTSAQADPTSSTSISPEIPVVSAPPIPPTVESTPPDEPPAAAVPQPDRTSAESPADPAPVAAPQMPAADENDGNEWLPHLPAALAVVRYRERMKSMPLVLKDADWGVPARVRT